MKKIILLGTLASPDGIRFAGYELEADDEQAALLVSTGAWRYVVPPDDWIELKPTPVPTKPKREYRKKK